MTRKHFHNLFASLRVAVVALWILSLISSGVTPLYYVSSTDVSASAVSASESSLDDSATSNKTPCSSTTDDNRRHSIKKTRDLRNTITLRFTNNPFVAEALNPTSKPHDDNSHDLNHLGVDPLDKDGGLAHNAPSGSPVVLWFVSAGASGTVASSNLTRFCQKSNVADMRTRRPSTGVITAKSICAEHPTKRFAATLLGQKPSGVS